MSNLLVPIILLISSIGLFFTYLSPGYATLQAFQDQDARISAAIVDFGEVIAKKNELANQYIEFDQDDLDTLRLIVPTKTDVVQTILILDKVAQENSLFVEGFEIPQPGGVVNPVRNPEVAPDEYGPSTFRIVVAGSYEGIRGFLYQIERSALLMDVFECFVESETTEDGQTVYRASIAINTYRLF